MPLSEQIENRILWLGLEPKLREEIRKIVEDAMAEKSCGTAIATADWPTDFEAQWWKIYPRREDKKPAMRALGKVRVSGISWAELVEGTEHYAAFMKGKETKYIKLPATFLNAESWKNRYNRNQEKPKSFLEAASQDF